MKEGRDSLRGFLVLAVCCGLPLLLLGAGMLAAPLFSKTLALGAVVLVGVVIVLMAVGRRSA